MSIAMQALVIMALLPPSAPFAPARGMSGRNLRLSPSAALAPIEGTSGRNRDVATVLTMASDGESSSRDNNKKKSSGVYARPSAAIERGSGFFIPGLEGSRVRLLFGILALVLTYVNNALGGQTSTGGFGISEAVAVVAGSLLLLQAAVEFGTELGFGVDLDQSGTGGSRSVGAASPSGPGGASSTTSNIEQRISSDLASLNIDAVDVVKWSGATLVALTPATHVRLVADGNERDDATTLYGLGDFSGTSEDCTSAEISALEEIYRSKGGRISIPPDHPVAIGLLPEEGRRCVLLQRVAGSSGKKACLVVGSNQLLQAFTKNDLRWLGRLGANVEKVL